MAKFAGRRGDLAWGKYDYPVTRTQKTTLNGLKNLMTGLPHTDIGDRSLPEGYFCSQRPDNGGVIVGLHHRSVTVHRSGRITSNQ